MVKDMDIFQKARRNSRTTGSRMPRRMIPTRGFVA
jgi:hypothetical protein